MNMLEPQNDSQHICPHTIRLPHGETGIDRQEPQLVGTMPGGWISPILIKKLRAHFEKLPHDCFVIRPDSGETQVLILVPRSYNSIEKAALTRQIEAAKQECFPASD